MTTLRTLLLVLYSTWSVVAVAQTSKETVTKSLVFEKASAANVFYLANINGSVTVEGYDGNSIEITAVKSINAKTQDRLDKAKQQIHLGVIDRMDTILVYVEGVCGQFAKQSENWQSSSQGWGYNWNDCEQNFDFKMEFKIKVPFQSNVYVSTINEGDIKVSGVEGSVSANNINGAISLSQIGSIRYAHTINGDVTLEFTKQPDYDASYYSLNGDIRANFPTSLSADLSFKSYNGELYTNIKELQSLPQQMILKKQENQLGVKYKLDGKTIMRAGKGGINLDFETFNGDVFVKELIN
jgi:DUF4097 and DUF4098 domain-containing protein YvlB